MRRLLALVAVLAASMLPSLRAAPLTGQASVETTAHGTEGSDAAIRRLQLFPTDLLSVLGDNATCPDACPLCRYDATDEDLDCFLSASVEACASNAFEECYAGLLGDFDVRGLCEVTCDKPEEEIPASFREVCRVCDIFACCDECPPERAAECFPSDVEDGYTPVGWEPATCASGGGEMGAAGWWMVPSVLLMTLGLRLQLC